MDELRRPDPGWGVTFAFWGTLLVAAALFAAVTLAPRFRTLAGLREEYAANQIRLVELERQAIELEQVADALEHDPRFAAELAKIEYAAPSDGESIAVPAELRIGAAADAEPIAAPSSAADWPIPPAFLDPLATHAGLRATLLAAASLLTFFAFAFLNEGRAKSFGTVADRVRGSLGRTAERYRRKEPLAKPQRPQRAADESRAA